MVAAGVFSVFLSRSLFTRGHSLSFSFSLLLSLDIGFNRFSYGKSEKGAALYLQGVVGDIHDSVFEYNAAAFGGAVFRGSTTGNLLDSTFTGNAAKSFGGGVYDSHVAGDIAGCKFAKNKASRGAGVFRTESKGDVGENKGLDDDTTLVNDNPANGE